MTVYGYARVSTSGQSLEEQVERLKEYGVPEEQIFSEKFSGKTMVRKEFNTLIDNIKDNDTIIITKLDRFARTTQEALAIINPLLERNVKINVLNLGLIENTTIGRMIVRTLLSVAEMERDMIVERTQEGKAFAKKNKPNYREGRPKRIINPQHRHAYDLLKKHSYKEVSKLTGMSVSTIQRVKNQIEMGRAENV